MIPVRRMAALSVSLCAALGWSQAHAEDETPEPLGPLGPESSPIQLTTLVVSDENRPPHGRLSALD